MVEDHCWACTHLAYGALHNIAALPDSYSVALKRKENSYNAFLLLIRVMLKQLLSLHFSNLLHSYESHSFFTRLIPLAI
jgi:hypothetical protein